jgi:hypothetical protein
MIVTKTRWLALAMLTSTLSKHVAGTLMQKTTLSQCSSTRSDDDQWIQTIAGLKDNIIMSNWNDAQTNGGFEKTIFRGEMCSGRVWVRIAFD